MNQEDLVLIGGTCLIGLFAIVFSIYLAVDHIKESKEKKEKKVPRQKDDWFETWENSQKKYLENILMPHNFLETNVPKIFSGLGSINLICLDKFITEGYHCVFTSLSKKSNLEKTNIDFYSRMEGISRFSPEAYTITFELLEDIVKNELPTFIFINIGKDSADQTVELDTTMRNFKKKFPQVKFYICCSSFHFEGKAKIIQSLTDDGTAENCKIYDMLISGSDEANVLAEKIVEVL